MAPDYIFVCTESGMFSRTIFFIFKISIEASISKLVDLYCTHIQSTWTSLLLLQ